MQTEERMLEEQNPAKPTVSPKEENSSNMTDIPSQEKVEAATLLETDDLKKIIRFA